MRTVFSLILSLVVLATAPALAGQLKRTTQQAIATPLQISLVPHAVIEGDVVRLGDLFNGLDTQAEIAVARAPELGDRVELNARWLAHLARGHDLPWRPNSNMDRVIVERASRTIGAPRIEAELMRALTARGIAEDVVLVLDNPDQNMVFPAEWVPDMTVAGLSYDPGSGRFTAKLQVSAAGQIAVKTVVTGRAVEMTEVPVLARQIEPGEVIRDGDIHWKRMESGRIARNVVLDTGGIVGKSPRRPIRIDQLVRAGDLRDPVMVPKNSLVTIRLRTQRMVLTAQGRALEDGASGNVIKVMNTKSNTVVNAVVAQPGTVEVTIDTADEG